MNGTKIDSCQITRNPESFDGNGVIFVRLVRKSYKQLYKLRMLASSSASNKVKHRNLMKKLKDSIR